jgi:hypothetical protein
MTSPAEVVPLRAEDAATETRVTESSGPAYADLSDGRAQRKAIIPAHWRTWAAAHEHVKLASGAAATTLPGTVSGYPCTWC